MLQQLDQQAGWHLGGIEPPVMIRLLGSFGLLKEGRPVVVPSGGKTEALLSLLALRHGRCVPRDTILGIIWPDHDPTLAGQALSSLIYSLRKQLGPLLGGAMPIVHVEGCYQLNCDAGVSIDLLYFEEAVQEGDRHRRLGDRRSALDAWGRAISVYTGDLWSGMDVHAAVERERLRACYLTILARLADDYYERGDYSACIEYAGRLLASDPCREDAHRLIMRCYVRQGERAQALRQYRLCAEILRSEFDALPEALTADLYEQVRSAPDSI
ncbi:MAG: AfsR/SARP family transcriptional regulator [Chloroflexia bacterium]